MIGKRIQELRMAKGLSLSELAERAGVSKSYISYIEREVHTNPSLQVLEKISAVLEIDLYSIKLKENDELAPPPSLDSEWIKWAREVSKTSFTKDDIEEYEDFLLWRKINDIFIDRKMGRENNTQDLKK